MENSPSHPNPGWSAATVDCLRQHWIGGMTTAEIASRLGRTVRAVECKIYKLRAQGCVLPARRGTTSSSCDASRENNNGFHRRRLADQRARRRCLYCGKDFDSSHHGNRICAACLEDGPFTSAMV